MSPNAEMGEDTLRAIQLLFPHLREMFANARKQRAERQDGLRFMVQIEESSRTSSILAGTARGKVEGAQVSRKSLQKWTSAEVMDGTRTFNVAARAEQYPASRRKVSCTVS